MNSQTKKLKVSFDFDSTLSKTDIQEYAKSLIEKGIEVHIVTDRFEDTTKCAYNNKYLFEVVNKLGIDKNNIHFLNMKDKYKFFLDNPEFIWHLDDDDDAMEFINDETKVMCIFNDKTINRKDICESLLKLYLK